MRKELNTCTRITRGKISYFISFDKHSSRITDIFHRQKHPREEENQVYETLYHQVIDDKGNK